MNSLASVFAAINRLPDFGLVASYAIGGGTAVLFYAEPTRTYDLDVFVIIPAPGRDELAPLAGIYEWARREQFVTEAEHMLIHGVPVQFLPAYTQLVEEAIRQARVLTYEGVPVRVVGPEQRARRPGPPRPCPSYSGFHEVEIFSELDCWRRDPAEVLRTCKERHAAVT